MTAAAAPPPASGPLRGRTALVTGSRRGIGFEIARRLAGAGARVLLNGRDAAALETVAAGLRAEDLDVVAFAQDVTDTDATTAALDARAEAGERISILVNNMGERDRRGLLDMDVAGFARLLHADLTSAFALTKSVAARLVAAGEAGSIINLSSTVAIRARAGDVGYNAAKAGLDGMTRITAAELGRHGIRVNSVAPGMISTETNAGLVADPEISAWVESRTALRRWGRADEIAGLVLFLAGDDASYITGQTLAVDGGASTVLA